MFCKVEKYPDGPLAFPAAISQYNIARSIVVLRDDLLTLW